VPQFLPLPPAAPALLSHATSSASSYLSSHHSDDDLYEFIDPAVAKVGKELIASIKALQALSCSVLLEAKLASAQGKSSGVSS
jgi:hypothetical protein